MKTSIGRHTLLSWLLIYSIIALLRASILSAIDISLPATLDAKLFSQIA